MSKRAIELLKRSGALLEGHFLLSSGKHSSGYCQCAQLLRFPALAAEVLSPVADAIRALSPTKLCGPAMGGVIVSYELARQLGVESIFTERVNGEMALRRGFSVSAGDRVIITEDVVTTGLSTMETVHALESLGASVIAVACIADRRAPDCALALPVFSAVQLSIPAYDPADCPLCKQGLGAAVKPGSRGL